MPGSERLLRLPRGRFLHLGDRPLVMGIVNVTPDSFFEGSRRFDPDLAVETALEMVRNGADIIDFGAESTRPGSSEVAPSEEISRLLPVIRAFRANSAAVVSVDTRHAETARAVLEEGADIINDIQALADRNMPEIAAHHGAAVVLMHMQGTPATMQLAPKYADCVTEVADFLRHAVARARAAGIPDDAIILDPGIGFGKLLEHNMDLLSSIGVFRLMGYPVLIGLSRKRMIGELTGREIQDRMAGSIGGALAAAILGADILRVHDVPETVDALKVCTAILSHASRKEQT
ncbi:MAG: dihydropteroate synthase [Spirochaetaceae bacterium]|nr:dihydropteroate synthase [Spirochaetaceae bacterium]